MIRTVRMTCILCPRGCELTALIGDGKIQTAGNACPKGAVYAESEIRHPVRVLTTTVRTIFADFPRLPVRTSREIPLGEMFRYMEAVNRLVCDKRAAVGEVVAKGLLGTDVDLIATDDMTEETE